MVQARLAGRISPLPRQGYISTLPDWVVTDNFFERLDPPRIASGLFFHYLAFGPHLLDNTFHLIVFALNMFHLRRSALRLLSSSPSSFVAKPRSYSSFAPYPLRKPLQSASIAFQRRWATGEAEAKKEDSEVPTSEIQPTPQEELENAISADNASEIVSADVTQTSSEPAAGEIKSDERTLQSAVNKATEAVSDAASSARDTYDRVTRETSYNRRGERNNEPKSTIYIGNLFFDVTENDLVKELARFGTITQCRLMRDSRGLSKGFGYVDFDNVESATKAIETLHQQLFEGRRLAVQYAAYESKKFEERRPQTNRPRNPPSKTLFIGNMSFEMTDRDLNNLFRGIRNVIDVRVAIDRRTGQPRGFAHADFVDVKSAMEGLKALEGKETYGRQLRIDYSYGPSTSPKNSGMPGSTPSEGEGEA